MGISAASGTSSSYSTFSDPIYASDEEGDAGQIASTPPTDVDEQSAPVVVAQATTTTIPLPGSVPFSGAAAGAGRVALALSRLSVWAAPLALSGDTPQPYRYDLGGGLTLFVSRDQTQAWFAQATPFATFGPVTVGGTLRRLDVPVEVRDGQLIFDAAELERAYGGPLPDSVMQMARPANVSNPALQTTSRATATAMAGAPDPCKNLPGQNHHIVPAQLMQQHERFLTQIGFQLDDPNNLIRLPTDATQQNDMQQMCGATRPIHNGSHGTYSQAVNQQLSRIEQQYVRGDITAAQARVKVDQLMQSVRSILNSGTYSSINDAGIARQIANLRI